MVKQAVRQTYTYYEPDKPEGDVVRNESLVGRGRAWTLGEYRHPTYPSPLNVRVGDAGIHVWMVINWFRLCNSDRSAVLSGYGQVLQPEDLDAALWFYSMYKDEIDEKLAGAA